MKFDDPEISVRRVHIIGGPGSGKSTLARRLAAALDAPVWDLDTVAFEGINFDERPLAAKQAAVREIALQPCWIAEGMFLGWTRELLEAADAIIWLDYLNWRIAAWRITARFARWGMEEAKRQPGVRKFTRFSDYARNLRHLGTALQSARLYYDGRTVVNWNGVPVESRGATASCLERYADKVIHCRDPRDIQALLAQIGQKARRVDSNNPRRESEGIGKERGN